MFKNYELLPAQGMIMFIFQIFAGEVTIKMSLVRKRSTEYLVKNPIDGLLVKKSKTTEVLKLSMGNRDVKNRILHLVKLLTCHIFATPFLKFEDDEHTQSFDDVLKKVEENKYDTSQEVFDDLDNILNKAIETRNKMNHVIVKSKNFKMLTYNQEDVEIMAARIRRKIYTMQETLFSGNTTDMGLDESLIVYKGDTDKIFQSLQKMFPLVPPEIIMAKALDISVSSSLDMNRIKMDLEETNRKYQPAFRSYKFLPSRTHEFNMEKAVHSYIAGYQFHKMITKMFNAPVPMRNVLNPSDAIESIFYIENKQSSTAYEMQKEIFKQAGKLGKNGKVEEMLLFHGTAVSSVESILTSNFLVDALPQQKNIQQEKRKKTMMFGRGVYFSELPAISLMYGNGLLLCKVLPGKCDVFKPQGVAPPEIPEEFDSREVLSNSEQGVIHVVKKPSQILPYCVIKLKPQSLSSQYIKPTPCTQPKTTTQPSRDDQSHKPKHTNDTWTLVTTDLSKADNKEESIKKTMRDWTRPVLPTDAVSECSICCHPAAGCVSLSVCGHRFHQPCIQAMLATQAGGTHIQCPVCRTIHGVKTGNQPRGGEMSYRRSDDEVPGYPGSGMIMVKYSFKDGIQDEAHPHPGKAYHARGFPRVGILPDNQQGNSVLALLTKAFQRRLIFSVGTSLSRGEDDCVVWGGIHHKTQVMDTGAGHGYPDISYLDRVEQELREHGVE